MGFNANSQADFEFLGSLLKNFWSSPLASPRKRFARDLQEILLAKTPCKRLLARELLARDSLSLQETPPERLFARDSLKE
jgi:hypothetical protein